MVSRREKKKATSFVYVKDRIHFDLNEREWMFWVRCLIRFHNKSHRRDCMSIRRQLTVCYSWMGFTWCFIIVGKNSGIFFFWAFFMRILYVFRHHIHSESNYERKIKISAIGMSIDVNFVYLIRYHARVIEAHTRREKIKELGSSSFL